MNPLVILELALKIVLLAMEGQTPEQRAKMWDWYVTDVEKFRKLLKLDETQAPNHPIVSSSEGASIRWVADGKSRVRNNRVR